MQRSEAIEIFAKKKLKTLSKDLREEHLYEILNKTWHEEPEWSKIKQDVQLQIINNKWSYEISDSRYDHVLIIWFKLKYATISNYYLIQTLDLQYVVGDAPQLKPCPCCGRKTLTSLSQLEICDVCWWEDDGTDRDNEEAIGGPNYNVSLKQARLNFIREGIYDPERTDLRDFQEPPMMYNRGRFFRIEGEQVVEDRGGWPWVIPSV